MTWRGLRRVQAVSQLILPQFQVWHRDTGIMDAHFREDSPSVLESLKDATDRANNESLNHVLLDGAMVSLGELNRWDVVHS
jgi:hypothetical protein